MSAQEQMQQHHYTPPWLDWIATNVVPSAMILAELIIVTGFFIVTSVRNPYSPDKWSYLEWALVVVAGFVGLAMAGLALKLSGQAAEMLATSHYMRGAFTFAGVLILACIETWAGIVERAQTIGVSAADLLLADYTGIAAFRTIPTSVFMVAFILPCLVLWYGWASRPPVVISSEEQTATHQKKLADARFKAEMRQIQAGGIGASIRAARDAASGHKEDNNLSRTQAETSGVFGAKAPASQPLPEGIGKLRPAAKGPWNKADLMAHMRLEYPQVSLTETAALAIIKEAGNETKRGTAFVATIMQVRSYLAGHYGPPKSERDADGTNG